MHRFSEEDRARAVFAPRPGERGIGPAACGHYRIHARSPRPALRVARRIYRTSHGRVAILQPGGRNSGARRASGMIRWQDQAALPKGVAAILAGGLPSTTADWNDALDYADRFQLAL